MRFIPNKRHFVGTLMIGLKPSRDTVSGLYQVEGFSLSTMGL